MILFKNMYFDKKILNKNKVVKKIVDGDSIKDYFVLLYDFNSNETFDILNSNHLPSLKNKEKLVLVGVAKSKPIAIEQTIHFFQDIVDTGVDILTFDFDEYIISNSKKE